MAEQSSSWSRQGGKLLREEHKIRLVIVALLLLFALTGWDALVRPNSVYIALLLMVAGYVISRFAVRHDRVRGAQQFQAGAAFLSVMDLVAVTLLLHGTGGMHSGFFSLYLVSLVFAAALFRGFELALLTVLAMLLYLGVSFPEYAAGQENPWHFTGPLMGMIIVAWYSYLLSGVLRREKEANDQLLRHLTEGVLLFDSECKVTLANATLLSQMNLREEDVIGKSRDELAGRDNVLSWVLGDVGSSGDGFRTRMGCFPEADLPLVECTTIPCSSHDEAGGWVVVCKDLRDLKIDVKAARRSFDKLAPLSNLRALSEALYGMADYLDDQKRWAAVEVIEKHTLALQAILAEMLHQGRDAREVLELDFIDVSSLLSSTRRLLEIQPAGDGIDLEIFVQQGLPEINADRGRLGQALLQLCKALMTLARAGDKLLLDVRSADRSVAFSLQLTNQENAAAQTEPATEAEVERLANLCDLPIFSLIDEHQGTWDCQAQGGEVREITFQLPISGPAHMTDGFGAQEAEAGERPSTAPVNWPLEPALAAEITNQLKNTLNVIRGYAEMAVQTGEAKRLEEALSQTIELSDQASELVDVLQPSTGEFDLQVKLPEGEEATEAPPTAVAMPGAALEGAILVVDDDASMRGLLVDVLQSAGYETMEAHDGKAAVETIRLTPPSLAFVDLSMPRVTGVEVMKESRKYAPGLPVVLMTGYATQVAVEALGEEKPYAILSKPFTIDDVLSLARAVVGSPD